jgi:hypothetical protein
MCATFSCLPVVFSIAIAIAALAGYRLSAAAAQPPPRCSDWPLSCLLLALGFVLVTVIGYRLSAAAAQPPHRCFYWSLSCLMLALVFVLGTTLSYRVSAVAAQPRPCCSDWPFSAVQLALPGQPSLQSRLWQPVQPAVSCTAPALKPAHGVRPRRVEQLRARFVLYHLELQSSVMPEGWNLRSLL